MFDGSHFISTYEIIKVIAQLIIRRNINTCMKK